MITDAVVVVLVLVVEEAPKREIRNANGFIL